MRHSGQHYENWYDLDCFIQCIFSDWWITYKSFSLSLINKLAQAKYNSLMVGVLLDTTPIDEVITDLFSNALPVNWQHSMLLIIIQIQGLGAFFWVFIILCIESGVFFVII